MKFIFVYIFVFFSIGIFSGYYLNIYINPAFLIFIIPLLFLGRSYISIVSFFLFILLFGIYLSPKKDNPNFLQETVFAECIVKSIPETYNDKKNFLCQIINSDRDIFKNKTVKVVLDSSVEDIFYGTRIASFGKVSRYKEGIYFFPANSFLVVDNSNNIFFHIFRFRKWLIHRYREAALSQDSYFLGLALIFGEKGEIPFETRKTFIKTGLIHLLAISGFHVGVFIFVVSSIFFFLKKSTIRKIILFSLPLYSFFTGLNIPVVRASFLGFMYFLGKSLYLEVNSLNILFFTGFLISLFFPEVLFSVGFQLSFCAATGILIFLNIHNPEKSFEKYIVFPFLISVVATTMTAPILAYHFGYLSLSGIFLTPFAVPFLYIYVFLSTLNLISFFSVKPLVLIMDYTGTIFLKFVSLSENISLFLTGFKDNLFYLLFFIIFIVFVLNIRISMYMKALILIVSLLFYLTALKEKPAFRIISIKGRFLPEIIVISEKKECFFYTFKKNNKLDSVMDKNGCLTKKFFSSSVYRKDFEIVRKKRGFLIKKKNLLKLYIENKNLSLTFSNDI